MKNLKLIKILILCAIVCFILFFCLTLSVKKETIKCTYEIEEVNENNKKSYSEAILNFTNNKLKDMTMTSYLYGPEEMVDNKPNESEERGIFLTRYEEYSTISQNIKVSGVNFNVTLDNDLIKYETKIDYNKVSKSEDGIYSLKNKSKNDAIKYLENINYICNK